MLYGPGIVRYTNRPVPTIDEPHDVLLRISYVGVCGSDVGPCPLNFVIATDHRRFISGISAALLVRSRSNNRS